jgi:hypothetical protein
MKTEPTTTTPTQHTVFWMEQRCPRCGSTLISNGIKKWCSFVGGDQEKGCTFGIDGSVKIEDPV